MKFILSLLLVASSLLAKEKVITLTADNHINFNQAFTRTYVAKKQLEFLSLIAKSNAKEFYIVLNSPGGSITAGNALIDTIKATGKKVHTITLFSASMSYNLSQNLGKRYITPSGIMMSHRARLGGLGGQIPGELNSQLALYERMSHILHTRASKRVGISLEQYMKDIYDKLWLIGQDAVDRNHADQTALVQCDDSLKGTFVEQMQSFFGVLHVEFSKCPIITSPVGISNAEFFVNKGYPEDIIMKEVENMFKRTPETRIITEL